MRGCPHSASDWGRQLSRAQERADHQTSQKSGEPNTSPRQAPSSTRRAPLTFSGAARARSQAVHSSRETWRVTCGLPRIVMSQFRTGIAFLPIFGIAPDIQRSNPGGGSPCRAHGGDPWVSTVSPRALEVDPTALLRSQKVLSVDHPSSKAERRRCPRRRRTIRPHRLCAPRSEGDASDDDGHERS